MLSNTEILVKEHEYIIMVLNFFEKEALHIKMHKIIRKDFIISMLDFFKNYADKLHHAKEEDHLFEMLIQKGMERKDSPVESMFMEHEKGRGHLRNVREYLQEENQTEIFEVLTKEMNSFVNLLRDHIDKENNMIFIMTENFISPEDDNELTIKYKKIESEHAEEFEAYRKYALEISA